MEHLPKPPCLYKRGNRYYLRKRIPLNLIGHYEQSSTGGFVIKALGTSDFREACKLLTQAKAKLENDFAVLERSLKKQPTKVTRQLEDLTSAERERIVVRWLAQEDCENNKTEADLLVTASDTEIEEALENLYSEQAYFTQETDRRDYIEGRATANSILQEQGISAGKDRKAFLGLSRLFTLAHHELIARSIQRLQERPVTGISEPLFSQVTAYAIAGNTANSINFGEACEKFCEVSKVGLRPRSIADIDKNIELLQSLIPSNTAIVQITHDQCREVYALLKRMPAHTAKKYTNKHISKAVELGKADGNPTISLKRANTIFGRLHAILKLMVQKGCIPQNPAAGIAEKVKKNRKKVRLPFNSDQLNKLFQAPIYTGCIDDRYNYKSVGDNRPRNARFWVPLIALWTGMRLEEICQLQTADVQHQDGVDYLQVCSDALGDDKSEKTDNSERKVPIHSELKRIGFLDYVAKIREQKHDHLFPTLTRSANGTFGQKFSKWFRQFKDSCGLPDRKIVFHSFRHNFRDACRNCGVSTEMARWLGGWAHENTDDDYGIGPNIKTLNQQMSKIEYPDLDLSHLYQKSE